MTLTIELPNDLAQREDAAREALIAVVLEAYRTDALTRRQAATMLGMGRLEFTEFLHARGLPATSYGVEELQQDIAAGDQLRTSGHLPG